MQRINFDVVFIIIAAVLVASSAILVTAYSRDSTRFDELRRYALLRSSSSSNSVKNIDRETIRNMVHRMKPRTEPKQTANANSNNNAAAAAVSETKNCPPRPFIPRGSSAGQVPPLPQSVITQITDYMTKYTQAPCKPGAHSPSAPGFAGAVLFGPHTYYINLGCRDVEKPFEKITNQSVFRLASVSKTFTVKMLLDAATGDNAPIRSLDDQVRLYVNDFFVPNPYNSNTNNNNSEQPTFRQMASQQAGLPRDSPCSPIDCDMNLTTAMRRLGRQRLLVNPWSQPSYSNVAFSLLGHIVAERLHKNATYETLLAQLTQQLGMNMTAVTLTPSMLANLAKAYTPIGIPLPPMDLKFDNPAGGVFSSSSDLDKWLRMWMQHFRQSSTYRQNMQPLFVDSQFRTMWSSPWEEFASKEEFGYVVRSKGGYLPGSSSIIAMVPEIEVGFVGLWNGEGFDSAAAGAFAINTILGQAVPLLRQLDAESFAQPSSDFLNGGWLGKYGIQLTLDAIEATIAWNSTLKRLTLDARGFGFFQLKPSTLAEDKGLVFQIHDPQSDYRDCVQQGFAGFNGEWVWFSVDSATNKKTMFAPGYVYEVFVKED